MALPTTVVKLYDLLERGVCSWTLGVVVIGTAAEVVAVSTFFENSVNEDTSTQSSIPSRRTLVELQMQPEPSKALRPSIEIGPSVLLLPR